MAYLLSSGACTLPFAQPHPLRVSFAIKRGWTYLSLVFMRMSVCVCARARAQVCVCRGMGGCGGVWESWCRRYSVHFLCKQTQTRLYFHCQHLPPHLNCRPFSLP